MSHSERCQRTWLIAIFSGLLRASATCLGPRMCKAKTCRIKGRSAKAERVAEMWLGRQVRQIMEGFVDLVKDFGFYSKCNVKLVKVFKQCCVGSYLQLKRERGWGETHTWALNAFRKQEQMNQAAVSLAQRRWLVLCLQRREKWRY